MGCGAGSEPRSWKLTSLGAAKAPAMMGTRGGGRRLGTEAVKADESGAGKRRVVLRPAPRPPRDLGQQFVEQRVVAGTIPRVASLEPRLRGLPAGKPPRSH